MGPSCRARFILGLTTPCDPIHRAGGANGYHMPEATGLSTLSAYSYLYGLRPALPCFAAPPGLLGRILVDDVLPAAACTSLYPTRSPLPSGSSATLPLPETRYPYNEAHADDGASTQEGPCTEQIRHGVLGRSDLVPRRLPHCDTQPDAPTCSRAVLGVSVQYLWYCYTPARGDDGCSQLYHSLLVSMFLGARRHSPSRDVWLLNVSSESFDRQTSRI